MILRLRDPRRFGAMLWAQSDVMQHALLAQLGPEPLTAAFTGTLLYRRTRGRRASIKEVLMNSRIVVGVGNIYANEALFRAGIAPMTPAGRLGAGRCQKLVQAIKVTLDLAIEAGGSSLRDFIDSERKSRLFSAAVLGIRPCGQALPQLRNCHLANKARAAFKFLLSALPK